MSSNALPAGYVQIQIDLITDGGLVADANTTWLLGATGPIATLAAPVGADDTQITIKAPVAFPSPSLAQLAAGITAVPVTLLIDTEPMVLTVPVTPGATVLAVTRGLDAFPFLSLLPYPPATTHANATPVMMLGYPSPWAMLADVLRNWITDKSKALGANSALFGAVVSGAVTVTGS